MRGYSDGISIVHVRVISIIIRLLLKELSLLIRLQPKGHEAC
jgi:hypothetical protein